MSSSSSTTRIRERSFTPASYHPNLAIPAPDGDSAAVARVLICEPHDDITALLELVVRRLGHEPVICSDDALDHVGVDAAVIEPSADLGLHVARLLREQGVPVLFTSIYPADTAVLELRPMAYLVKPFPLYALERAPQQALDPAASAVAL